MELALGWSFWGWLASFVPQVICQNFICLHFRIRESFWGFSNVTLKCVYDFALYSMLLLDMNHKNHYFNILKNQKTFIDHLNSMRHLFICVNNNKWVYVKASAVNRQMGIFILESIKYFEELYFFSFLIFNIDQAIHWFDWGSLQIYMIPFLCNRIAGTIISV